MPRRARGYRSIIHWVMNNEGTGARPSPLNANKLHLAENQAHKA